MQEQFSFLSDPRSSEQKEFHGLVVDYLTYRNLTNMNIPLSLKRKVRYIPSKTFQIDLSQGWYCTITDNQIKSKHTIFTCHGCPGDEKDWAGLESEMKNEHRWVNIVLPGFDGIDERRGNYRGTLDDIMELILRLMKKLGVQKIIGCGHSMGSFVFTMFLEKHPDKIEGFATVAGVVDYWYVGLLTFYNQTIVSNGFNKPEFDIQKMALDEDFRIQKTKETNQRTRPVHFAGVNFPQLLPCQLIAYTKFMSSFVGGISTLFRISRNLAPSKLRVYLFGKPDSIQNYDITEGTMYRRVYGQMRPDTRPAFFQKYRLVRKDIVEKCNEKHNVKIDIQNIQSNFVFHFPETGHNVHKRRPAEIAKILNVYITVLDELERGQSMLKSKL